MNGIVAKSMMWNLWHGCHKLSAGCKHCYVYRGDARPEGGRGKGDDNGPLATHVPQPADPRWALQG